MTYLPVGKDGIVSVESVKSAIREDTALVSVMYVNNEIGVIQPIGEIGKLFFFQGICNPKTTPQGETLKISTPSNVRNGGEERFRIGNFKR